MPAVNEYVRTHTDVWLINPEARIWALLDSTLRRVLCGTTQAAETNSAVCLLPGKQDLTVFFSAEFERMSIVKHVLYSKFVYHKLEE
jgi:hypothetical protein